MPAGTLVPWVYVEIDDSHAGVDEGPFRTLLIGQKLGTGSVAAGESVRLGDAEDAAAKFGRGGMLHLMTAAFRRQNPIGNLYGLAIADPTGAPTAPKSTVTVTGAATAAGAAVVYVAGRRITAAVANAAVVATVATAIRDAINAYPDLPATATANLGVVTVTARQTGAEIDLDVRASYFADDGQPAGIDIAVADVAGGGNVLLGAALDDVADRAFDLVVHPYTATTPMNDIETDLAARWNAQVQLDGQAIAARRGTYTEQGTWAGGRSSRFSTVMDMSDAPQCDYEWAAAVAGQVALSAASDPALPFQTLQLIGGDAAHHGEPSYRGGAPGAARRRRRDPHRRRRRRGPHRAAGDQRHRQALAGSQHRAHGLLPAEELPASASRRSSAASSWPTTGRGSARGSGS